VFFNSLMVRGHAFPKRVRCKKTAPETGPFFCVLYPLGVPTGKCKFSMTNPLGKLTEYEYDTLNRLTKIDYPTDTGTIYIYDETDVTNGKGKFTTMQDATGVTRYSYDARGNLVQEHKTMGLYKIGGRP
jgi:YD repeat-containing protein